MDTEKPLKLTTIVVPVQLRNRILKHEHDGDTYYMALERLLIKERVWLKNTMMISVGEPEDPNIPAPATPLVISEVYTVPEVARKLRTSLVMVRKIIKRGDVPAIKVGREYRITKKDLDKFLEKKMSGAKR